MIKEIFVDETLLKIYGQDYWLWIAYEPNVKSCVMMHLSRERTIFVCYQFFRQLRNRYGTRKPIETVFSSIKRMFGEYVRLLGNSQTWPRN